MQDPIQFTNNATGNFVSVTWDFGDSSVSNELNPIHVYSNEGDFIVVQTVTYPFGCIYKYTTTLRVNTGYSLMIPDGFTPNNDKINDNFAPFSKGLKEVKLEIYDTWGDMIFSEQGENLKGWDGKIKGFDAENGNYFYKVTATTFYGLLINKNAPITLIK
jgi:gliding motility-associated-like protein